MARIRSVKPEFWTDEKIVTLSPFARLLFIGLWNFVDDEGRAVFSPARFKMQIFPADNLDISELFDEIRRNCLICIYAVDGKEYLQVCNFSRHQKIDKRAASKLPPPTTSAEFPRITPNPAESPPIPTTDQGKEGIKEGNGKEDAAVAAPEDSDEVALFKRGKKILGQNSGGLIKQLLQAKNNSIPLARAALETAATKQDAREYIGAIVRGRDSPESLRARGEAW